MAETGKKPREAGTKVRHPLDYLEYADQKTIGPFASQVFEHALHEADREFEKAVEELRVQGEHPRRDRAA